VDQTLLRSLCFCFPNSRSRESNRGVENDNNSPENFTTERSLPEYTGPELSEKTFEVQTTFAAPRYFPPLTNSELQPPPYYPADGKPRKPNPLQPKPLRLVRAAKKQKPPVLFEAYQRELYQSLTTLSFDTSTSPPPPYDDDTMASNPALPKVLNAPPNGPPRPYGSGPSQSKDELLADLRRQLDDSASDVGSSVDSRGRRRRRNNKALAAAGGLSQPAVLPRLAETKPVRLQLGLNLDVELELKARLQGDVSLTLL
jgi:hypothetical protein